MELEQDKAVEEFLQYIDQVAPGNFQAIDRCDASD